MGLGQLETEGTRRGDNVSKGVHSKVQSWFGKLVRPEGSALLDDNGWRVLASRLELW